MPTQLTVGMSSHIWWKQVCDLSKELDVLPSKPIHEALDIIMPTFVEVLKERVEHRKKEKELLKNLVNPAQEEKKGGKKN